MTANHHQRYASGDVSERRGVLSGVSSEASANTSTRVVMHNGVLENNNGLVSGRHPNCVDSQADLGAGRLGADIWFVWIPKIDEGPNPQGSSCRDDEEKLGNRWVVLCTNILRHDWPSLERSNGGSFMGKY